MPLLQSFFNRRAGRKAAEAAFAGQFDRAFGFIDKGGSINTLRWVNGPWKEGDGETAGGEGNIGYAALRHHRLDMLEKALDRGLDPNLQSPYRSPLLVFAIMHKQEDAALLLLARGAKATGYLLSDCISPLALASMYHMPELVRQIEAKLTPTALETERQSDMAWGVKPAAAAPEKKTNRLNM